MNYKFIFAFFFIPFFMLPAFGETSTNFMPNAVVASDGTGNFKTVQEAINSVSDNNKEWFVIFIKKGIYKEKLNIPATKTFVKFIGEDKNGTILTYDDCSSIAKGTAKSASTSIWAADFLAQDITFQNAFDYDNTKLPDRQAVAVLANADRQIFVNCRFLSFQDTLFLRAGRQYFKDCYIEGHTDFIFGDSTGVFDNCEIHALYTSDACVSAPSTLEETKYGLIFLNCRLTGDPKYNGLGRVYLGRPWHPSSVKVKVNSNAVYIKCFLDTHINPYAWTDMMGVKPATERLFEYKNEGPRAKTDLKTSKFRRQLSFAEAAKYTISNIFSEFKGVKDNWTPSSVLGK